MSYNVTATSLPEVLLLTPNTFEDDRGFFYESFNQQSFFEATRSDLCFVQDNHSRSNQGVLRGLHYQLKHPQGKLIRVTQGVVFDVVVDLRKTSSNFGKWYGTELSETNKKQIWVPPGFAHGFFVLSSFADFLYKTTDYWYPEHECSLLWNDPDINISWPFNGYPKLSQKDFYAKSLRETEVFF